MWCSNILVLLLVCLSMFCGVARCVINDADAAVFARLSERCVSSHGACLQKKALEGLVNVPDEYEFSPGISVALKNEDVEESVSSKLKETPRSSRQLQDTVNDPESYIVHRVEDYLNTHVLNVNLSRAFDGWQQAVGYPQNTAESPRTGRNTFLTGFGLGFLAFALKKLLLPVFIGAQIIKSVLIAMFLPTLLSGIGKFLGKSGATVFGASSGPSEDFDFKDNYDPSSYDTAASTNTATFTYPQNRFENAQDNAYTNPSKYYLTGSADNKLSQSSLQSLYKRPQYRRPQTPVHSNLDFASFQKIPSASLMLSDFDPFYSPLLSRLDSIFQQLGYNHGNEACREKLVCNMYNSPAKYVPYSNLVSAQLSRELNELHKPLGNPGVHRFFHYMKAAKDGQDGGDCDALYAACTAPELQKNGSKASSEDGILGSPPMVQTYHEINKLVQARRLAKQIQEQKDAP